MDTITTQQSLTRISNMNKIKAIETFSEHFNRIVDRSKRAWEESNDGDNSEALRKSESDKEKECGEILESMCALLGIEIYWPGLYPSFKVNGYSCHTIEDALAMKEGFPSIGAMKHELGVTNVSN